MNQIYQILHSIRRVLSLPSMIFGTARSVKRDAGMVSKAFKKKEKNPSENK
ncbi:MAG: hypothetical protein M9926_09455 [Lentimicrobium sp.]|jgi:hypothetical protein|uniref:hypothetical protein n=1 Tax=Lentimicrobium sp. TaxID=2034841 RepID=UPI0025CD7D03|nr:hypothetical protein [Lentimicrobium sp.]MCO5256973.1 hypothetical protein [Lentimicrobium sp.]MCO5261270.1 hypothetical protein [Lentimicrobium sp.]MEA5110198.1 hypothetical protein [Lentimicrobium sp.]HPG32358.1 hypothetical protein [Lentimicrobium sp.]